MKTRKSWFHKTTHQKENKPWFPHCSEPSFSRSAENIVLNVLVNVNRTHIPTKYANPFKFWLKIDKSTKNPIKTLGATTETKYNNDDGVDTTFLENVKFFAVLRFW